MRGAHAEHGAQRRAEHPRAGEEAELPRWGRGGPPRKVEHRSEAEPKDSGVFGAPRRSGAEVPRRRSYVGGWPSGEPRVVMGLGLALSVVGWG